MKVIDVSDWNGNEWEYELIPIEPEPEPPTLEEEK